MLFALALSGVVAAFATMAPAPEATPIFREAVIEPVAVSKDGLVPGPTSYVREARYQRGETLASLLAKLGLRDSDAGRLVKLGTLHLLRPGMTVTATVAADGRLVRLSYLNGRETIRSIVPHEGRFRVIDQAAQFETSTLVKSAEIRSSLFGAADAAGIPDSVAIQLADIFGGDIDFYRDLRKGDRFSVVYEMHYLLGRAVRSGRVVAAEFVNKGKSFRAVYYVDAHGRGGYYAPDGQSLRKAFLRAPLEFSRISSRFGMRKHPFLHSWRKHTGVDYAAPQGTRVRATGDGVVAFAGRKGGYGNAIIIQHGSRYSTLYGHLSGFARGIRTGAHVTQGKIIGYVGMTGLATGPHLHYEFRVNGVHRNPLTVHLPDAAPLPARFRDDFMDTAEPLLAQLDTIDHTATAILANQETHNAASTTIALNRP